MALIGSTEDLHLDCKIWPSKEDEMQRMLAKALCGFANADGGVIVIGMQARRGPDKDNPDLIEKAVPVSDIMAVKSRIEDLVGQIVEPGLDGVELASVEESPGAQSGFVVISVPPTEGFPCRSRKDWKFYQRISAGTYPMDYFQIVDMFGKRRRPVLSLYLEEGMVESRNRIPTRTFIIGIENSGRAIAKFPSLRLKRGGFDIDSFGIDGNHGFGLPQLPSDSEWIIFGGGSDHVIHAGTILKITRIEQPSRESEWQRVGSTQRSRSFAELTLNAQLAADEFLITLDSRTIAPKDLLR